MTSATSKGRKPLAGQQMRCMIADADAEMRAGYTAASFKSMLEHVCKKPQRV
jgi:hypothetical protein